MDADEPVVEQAPEGEAEEPARTRWKLVGGGLALAAAGLAAWFLPVADLGRSFLGWVEGFGPWAAVIIALVYVPLTVLLIPGTPLSLGAGFLFGVLWGTVAISVGSTVGAACAFLVGRTIARDWVREKVRERPRFQAIDRAIEREGLKIVFLTRLVPIFPFNFQNYAYAVTSVRFRDYVLASWIGMIPGTIMYVYFGSAAKNLADIAAGRVGGGLARTILFWGGMAAVVLVVTIVTRTARGILEEEIGKDEGETPEGTPEEAAPEPEPEEGAST